MKHAIKRHRRKFQTRIRRAYRKNGTIPLMAQVNCGVEEDQYFASPGESFEDFAAFIRRTAAKRGSWIAFVSCPVVDDGGQTYLLELFPYDEPDEVEFSLTTQKQVS